MPKRNNGQPEYKYNPKYVAKVDAYLKTRRDSEVEVVKATGKNEYVAYEQKLKVKLPTIEGFAMYLGVSRKSLYNWADNHKDFAAALEKIKFEQLQRLIDCGLEGSYNPTIAKLILSSNHDMKEKSDITSDDKPLPLLDYVEQAKNGVKEPGDS